MKKPLNQVLFGWLRKDLLMMFSGDPEGGAPWVAQMADGHDAGYFGPDSAVWHVNGAAPTLVLPAPSRGTAAAPPTCSPPWPSSLPRPP